MYPMALMCLYPLSGETPCYRTCLNCQACAKSDPWVARVTLSPAVANNTNSDFRILVLTTKDIEPFFVAVVLKWGLGTNQLFPLLTTHWSGAVLAISNQWVERVRLLVDDNEPELLVDLHTETDLGEGCVPVGG